MAGKQSKKIKIHIVSANAPGQSDIKLEDERRLVYDSVPDKKRILTDTPHARFSDVLRDLRSKKPHIIHFSAHGNPSAQIVLLAEDGREQSIPRSVMTKLLDATKGQTRVVVLSFCFSNRQAQDFRTLVDCVIGIEKAIEVAHAQTYTKYFYRGLADGYPVGMAHDNAVLELRSQSVPDEQIPKLLLRDGVDANEVYLLPGRHIEIRPPELPAERDKRFQSLAAYYGVFAKELFVEKVCGPAGLSELTFRISGLTPVRNSISCLRFGIETAAGTVGEPRRSESMRRDGIMINRDKQDEPTNMQEVLDRSQNWYGTIDFGFDLEHPSSLDLEWYVQVLNDDANDTWEYHQLYGSEPKGPARQPIAEYTEYFARKIWIPFENLKISLRLPEPTETSPSLLFYEIQNHPFIPKPEVLKDGKLRTNPCRGSQWVQRNVRWVRSRQKEKEERKFLNANVLDVEFPYLGSMYSLDWQVPNRKVSARDGKLISEAEVIRDELRRHGEIRRDRSAGNENTEAIQDEIKRLHTYLRKKLGAPSKKESFQTALMTYDRHSKTMVMVEGRQNDSDLPEQTWNFWLPFGCGMAGGAFRTGRSFAYSDGLVDPEKALPIRYLPVPNLPAHTCLLALPIDHPKTGEEFQAPRCRQLVAVLSIGSFYSATTLRRLCEGDGDVEKEIDQIRLECQASLNIISNLLLDETKPNSAAGAG
ncbi:MAG TPA: hypothetical protein VE621_04960 [Bryobacteraceae bacterium]|nr:hypothetical protein [Bryobacteraceae bacterium]